MIFNRFLLPVLVVAAVALHPTTASSQTGTLTGQVVSAESGLPLPFTGVSIVDGTLERFTTDNGQFNFQSLAVGRVIVRVRHVGYVPKTIVVTIDAATPTVLRVELARVAVILPVVHVRDALCVAASPTESDDPALASAIQQLRLNAEQFRLVSRSYPFASVFSQEFGVLTSAASSARDSAHAPGKLDTTKIVTRRASVVIRSEDAWRYKPGEVITSHRGITGEEVFAVNIPTIAVFADSIFLMNHCFRSAGVANVGGQSLLQLDFRAADRIKSADLDGSIFLDTAQFLIRRSQIWLSKRSDAAEAYDSVSVETWFNELMPGVPVIALMQGRNMLTPEASDERSKRAPSGSRIIADVETQRLTDAHVIKNAKSDDRGAEQLRAQASSLGLPRQRLLGVYDPESGEPIAGVQVTDSISGLTIWTSSTGTLGLAFFPQSIKVLHLTKTGYAPARLSVKSSPADSLPITFLLHRTGAAPP